MTCHPYLCNGLEEDIRGRRGGEGASERDLLVASSGKMVLLDKLLPKLRAEGHKVRLCGKHLTDPWGLPQETSRTHTGLEQTL